MTRSANSRRYRWAARALGLVALLWVTFAARSSHIVEVPFPPDASAGRLIVLPGIHNTVFHLNGFLQMARRGLPNFAIDPQRWGTPFLGILNLRAAERNRAVAQRIAADIVQWRRSHPGEQLYLMGYSGGGGIAALVLEELPDGVLVDRLVLVAPAISQDFEIEQYAAQHVVEFVINYASTKDWQVGIGTRSFGTIDRKYEYAAGYDGFAADFDGLAQWQWREVDRSFGHRGNHIAYLGRRWQHAFLLPAIDPAMTRSALESLWSERREHASGE